MNGHEQKPTLTARYTLNTKDLTCGVDAEGANTEDVNPCTSMFHRVKAGDIIDRICKQDSFNEIMPLSPFGVKIVKQVVEKYRDLDIPGDLQCGKQEEAISKLSAFMDTPPVSYSEILSDDTLRVFAAIKRDPDFRFEDYDGEFKTDIMKLNAYYQVYGSEDYPMNEQEPRNIIEVLCTQAPTDPYLVLNEEEQKTVNKIAEMYFKNLESDIVDINWDALLEKLPELLEIPEIANSEKMYGDISNVLELVKKQDYHNYEECVMPLVRDYGRIISYSNQADLIIHRMLRER